MKHALAILALLGLCAAAEVPAPIQRSSSASTNTSTVHQQAPSSKEDYSPPIPPLAITNTRCRLLCKEGLGGSPCGCPPRPVAAVLNKHVNEWRLAHPEKKVILGPRHDLCPSLCAQNLGQPLCQCTGLPSRPEGAKTNWCPVCHAVLLNERDLSLWRQLGCNDPKLLEQCQAALRQTGKKRDVEGKALVNDLIVKSSLVIPKEEEEVDWNLWCEIECQENNGGLACNCDMLPLAAN